MKKSEVKEQYVTLQLGTPNKFSNFSCCFNPHNLHEQEVDLCKTFPSFESSALAKAHGPFVNNFKEMW